MNANLLGAAIISGTLLHGARTGAGTTPASVGP
jgi:hypothetical protein